MDDFPHCSIKKENPPKSEHFVPCGLHVWEVMFVISGLGLGFKVKNRNRNRLGWELRLRSAEIILKKGTTWRDRGMKGRRDGQLSFPCILLLSSPCAWKNTLLCPHDRQSDQPHQTLWGQLQSSQDNVFINLIPDNCRQVFIFREIERGRECECVDVCIYSKYTA